MVTTIYGCIENLIYCYREVNISDPEYRDCGVITPEI